MSEADMTDTADVLGFGSLSAEDSEGDRAEQSTPAYDEPRDTYPTDLPLEVDPADAVEQNREVAVDDDYPHE
ncbi:hypothetical protein MWU77_03570 [Rhodococcus sp. F64268]|uniref:hypothetical protein n=1 Tax=unclassified Rhodococcus (in: high G+C Gram-positive bacteria) TaxID=192944 RepID=UPI001F0DFCF6|nr:MULTISPECIES: hypothetical protein [unclassified Rhodococcus (in: high G+C Gram-positive bacteria)]MCK0089858.1 hypothetical protein [Rhodococcus sp. F64268]